MSKTTELDAARLDVLLSMQRGPGCWNNTSDSRDCRACDKNDERLGRLIFAAIEFGRLTSRESVVR